jgi:Reverse transcriptase (RNA-dependent DNA polymerase)
VLAKVFAQILNARLNLWAEAGNHRPCSQAGFRPKYNTTMQAFVLCHMIDQHRKSKKPLFVCFVDFKKAFDSVPRHKLWQRMHDKGIRGRMLFAVQALYEHVTFAIKLSEGLSPPFPSNIGVRQGCPLSPFLFGLFIEMFDEELSARQPLAGPLLNVQSGPRVPLLYFADDLALLALSRVGLQVILDELARFSDSSLMSVNLRKTSVVVFKTGQPLLVLDQPCMYKGSPVEVSLCYRYLGLVLHAVKPIKWAALDRLDRAKESMGKMLTAFRATGAQKNVWKMLLLFKTMVMPSLVYGCEVWGLSLIGGDGDVSKDALSQFRLCFFRHLLGLRSSTPSWAILRELGEYPLRNFIVLQCVKFYSKVMSMPEPCLAKQAMQFSMSQSVGWCSSLLACLNNLGCAPITAQDVCYETVLKALLKVSHDVFVQLPLPQFAPSNVVKLASYHHVFADVLPGAGMEWRMHSYLKRCQPYDLVTKVARFRLGSHNLEIETGRWRNVQRNLRHCTRPGCPGCGCVVDDEYHAFFVCGAFDHIRAQGPLSQVLSDMRFWQFRPWVQYDLLPLFGRCLKQMNVC